jgi:uncharacterized protein YPO0396
VAESFGSALGRLGIEAPASAEAFSRVRTLLDAERARIGAEGEQLGEERDARLLERNRARDETLAMEAELDSLKRRTTSIPAHAVRLRRELAEAVGADESELPFAGELFRVRPEERLWEAAAERVLRSFALSVLVPESRYRAVSEYVRKTSLGARIVYYRIPEKTAPPARASEKSLARVLEVKPNQPFKPWLEAELSRRAALARCPDMESFYREPDAVTPEGLVKSGAIRHEKDDRPKVADPRNFVLGWSNAEKIRLMETDLGRLMAELSSAERRLADAETSRAALERRKADLAEALRADSFDAMDVASCVARYRELGAERQALEASSDRLAELKAALDKTIVALRRLDEEISKSDRRVGAIESELERLSRELASSRSTMEFPAAKDALPWFPKIDAFSGRNVPTLDAMNEWRSGLLAKLESRRSTQERKDSDARGSLLKRMHEFLGAFPERGAELSVGVDFAKDFRALLEKIRLDDLPAYEKRFRDLLRESTLRDIALFHTELDEDARAIHRSIGLIDESIRGIEYNPGTYISLAAEPAADQAVREFRDELRRCLEGTGSEEELYSEDRFLRVKNLLGRLSSPSPADRAWTERVTDARAWFTFNASERWIADGSEKEFYSSSSGKSGGQKEKLAYTILASALAHQYRQGPRGAEGGFRLVVIDEAFGRGSEESTRYGLRLFESLGLQLVLVTPLQKIGVIEGSVSSIHFISNPSGSASEVRSLGIEDYREGKAARAASGGGT